MNTQSEYGHSLYLVETQRSPLETTEVYYSVEGVIQDTTELVESFYRFLFVED